MKLDLVGILSVLERTEARAQVDARLAIQPHEIEDLVDVLRIRGYRVGRRSLSITPRQYDAMMAALVDSCQRHGHSMGSPAGQVWSYGFSVATDFNEAAEFPTTGELPADQRGDFWEEVSHGSLLT